ncbi:MAG: DUF3095 domain-containing protein [Myxococcota bacterium]
MTSERFFADLPPFDGFVGAVEPRSYHDVPDDWCVAITDVEGSTAAIAAGRYKDVNVVGAASIVSVNNAAKDLLLPYVFGGDGTTLLFPASRRAAIEVALRGVRRLARERFDLGLRIGVVPVDALRRDGFEVQVARFRLSPWVSLAMLAGSGIAEAERRIKSPELGERYSVADSSAVAHADLDGFECRFEPMRSRHGHIVSLLVVAKGTSSEERAAVYHQVLDAINGALDDVSQANPARHESINIASGLHHYQQESRLRGGAGGLARFIYALTAWGIGGVGRFLLWTGWRIPGFDGSKYRDEVIAHTDFRKFDEMLRMVIDVTPAQLATLEQVLAEHHTAGHIAYGLHTSTSAIMTCLIQNHEREHVHLVDGADGGYAMASVPLKKQLTAGVDAI